MMSLRITEQQMAAFDTSLLAAFRLFMLDWLRQSAQEVFAGKTDEEVLAYVDNGIRRARAYDATEQSAYGMFISASVLLGEDFDTSGRYPWAQEALRDPAYQDANARMDNLMVQVALYFDDTDGEDEP
jgi:hypothetical protein